MDKKELRQIFFVLITAFLIAAIIGVMKLGGLTLVHSGLLFIAAAIGLLIYKNEKGNNKYDSIRLLLAALVGFILIPVIRERIILSQLVVLALFFAIMLSIPPILLEIRKRLFNPT